jgi:hypothetical protein
MNLPAPPVLGTVQRPTSSGPARPKASQIAEAMRRRIIWAEVLGQPLALRDDERSF